jgi:3-ketosteroid 9alpha-monooxygenase subunit A
MSDLRFPFPMPFGWFHVAYPSDLAAGAVVGRHWLGRELVLWRDDAGEPVDEPVNEAAQRSAVHAADAFCPHLGAHLAVGGTVERGALRCPFHGWRFDGSGACIEIPYSDRVNRKARLRTYPTVERNGFVMAWIHPDDAVAPLWEIPEVTEVGDPQWSDYVIREFDVRAAPQEMAENAVDPAHFRYVHGTEYVADVEEYRTEGPCAVMLSKQGYVTPKGSVEGRIDVTNFGPGFSFTWFRGIIDALLVGTTTPVDEGLTKVRFHFTVKEPRTRLADAFIDEIEKQMRQDIPIWENKRYLPVPALADTDGPIMRFRAWYSQFYARAVDA